MGITESSPWGGTVEESSPEHRQSPVSSTIDQPQCGQLPDASVTAMPKGWARRGPRPSCRFGCRLTTPAKRPRADEAPGSPEGNEVIVALLGEGPLLTRALRHAALTRLKKQVRVLGTEAGIERLSAVSSGLVTDR